MPRHDKSSFLATYPTHLNPPSLSPPPQTIHITPLLAPGAWIITTVGGGSSKELEVGKKPAIS